MNKLLYIWFVLLLLQNFQAQASHIKTANISYTCLGNNQYEISFKLYSSCDGIAPPLNAVIDLEGLGNCADTISSITLPRVSSIINTVACPSFNACSPTNPIRSSTDYIESVYTTTITLPNTLNNCSWRLSYNSCCRTNSITNIVSPGSQSLYTETILLDSGNICNSSPSTTSHPVIAVCGGSPISLSTITIDPDGDSLVYRLASTLSNATSPVPLNAGFSVSQPFAINSGSIVLDNATGTLSFNGQPNQLVNFDIIVEEYRNGQLIGSFRNPLSLSIIAGCSSAPAVLDSVARFDNGGWISQGTSTTFDICPGESLMFELYFSDVDATDSLSIDALSSSLTQTYPNVVIQHIYAGTNYNQLTLQITIPFSSISTSTVGIQDNNCPLRNIQVYALQLVERIGCNRISGYAFADANGNCSVDLGEDSLGNYLVTVGNGGFNMTVSTDAQGYYDIPLNPGTYSIALSTVHPYRALCTTAQTVTLAAGANLVHDLPVQETASCPYMTVDIGAPGMTRCFSNYYVVSYCNLGTADANSVSIDVTLDPLFVVDSSNLPIANQSGGTYTFNVGTVPPNGCGSFRIYGQLDTACTSPLGSTICATAYVHPDTTCGIWSGAALRVEGRCNNDSVSFRIKNISQQAMIGPTPYTVFEDNVVLHTGSNVNLGGGTATGWINYPATGATYRLEIDQEAGYPWGKAASATVEGCLSSSLAGNGTTTGLVNTFSLDDGAPYIATDCQPIIGSYDPNDKQAFPVGYGLAHYIEPNEDLVYRVRFQNTGTAPARDVVIVDTLSSYLDVSTLQLAVASHSYTWILKENRILEVTFADIMLPDSASAPVASQGFVDFKIKQVVNNPLGTIIHNTAAIYFDRNAPIITNTTFHTIDENFIQFVQLPRLAQGDALTVTAFPNPFAQATTLRVKGAQSYETLTLTVYNALGQLVAQVTNQNSGQEITLERQQLANGLYFYRLEGDQQLLHTGQLIAQ